jgi:hypothetical protein
MALDGLEDRLRARFKRRGKVNLIRFADDFVITGESRAILEQDVMPLVTEFLQERGLVLAPEKTRIVHIDEGFDFLGFHFRKYGGKLLIKPARASIDHISAKVKTILQKGQHWPQSEIIRTLNPVLRGWGNYYRHVASKAVFLGLDQRIWRMTWNWARRRHPQKEPTVDPGTLLPPPRCADVGLQRRLPHAGLARVHPHSAACARAFRNQPVRSAGRGLLPATARGQPRVPEHPGLAFLSGDNDTHSSDTAGCFTAPYQGLSRMR